MFERLKQGMAHVTAAQSRPPLMEMTHTWLALTNI